MQCVCSHPTVKAVLREDVVTNWKLADKDLVTQTVIYKRLPAYRLSGICIGKGMLGHLLLHFFSVGKDCYRALVRPCGLVTEKVLIKINCN